MLPTVILNRMPTTARIVRLLTTAALLAWPAAASAGVPWHADLESAHRASLVSHRPVLAIFTASWSPAATALDRTALASDEAVALVTACFEAVCVDVDANPEATRRLGITRVPTACVMSDPDHVMSRFEIPATPVEFVAAAARAAQEAAFASATGGQPRDAGEQAVAVRGVVGHSSVSAGSLSAFGGDTGSPLRIATAGENRGAVPPGGPAITAVAAKVRKLSDFASDDAPPSTTETAIAASFRETEPTASAVPTVPSTAGIAAAAVPPQASASPFMTPPAAAPATVPAAAGDLAAASSAPSVPVTAPPAPARDAVVEPIAAPPAGAAVARTVPAKPLSIEPAPATAPSRSASAASWLGLPQREPSTTPAPADAMPQLTAAPTGTAAPAQATAPQPGTPPAATAPQGQAGTAPAVADSKPQPAKPSSAASLLATLQKPFSLFSKPTASNAKPATAATPGSSQPTAVATTASAPTATAEADAYGSMPVGLEGYCPVTLTEQGAWVEGRAQWGVRHRGRTYLFAGEAQQKAFLADPDRFAPAMSGDDPVLAFDAGKCTPGQRRYGVTYQSRMYLFSSPQTRDAFAANPQRYTSGAMVAENRGPAGTPGGPVIR
jgi:YHS domain-containing protein